MHDFCFIPDFANALYVASQREDAYGKFWICPHSIHTETLEDIADEVNGHLDKEVEGFRVVSPWMLSSMSYFTSSSVELKEMLPWWTEDYTVQDSQFCEAFHVKATPFEEAIKQTVQWFKTR